MKLLNPFRDFDWFCAEMQFGFWIGGLVIAIIMTAGLFVVSH